jgi:hypothetical protein
MENSRTYISTVALVGLSLSAIVAAVNWVVDPYGLFDPAIELTLVRPERANHERELKAHRVTQIHASGLVLGASTSAAALDPAHPGWQAENPYNMAVGQGSISIAYQFLLHAAEFEMPTQVILGVELAMFNPNMQNLVGLTPDALAVLENGEENPEYATRNYYGKLLSKSMLKSSVTSIIATSTSTSPNDVKSVPVGENGLLNSENFEFKNRRTRRNHFQLRISEHMTRFWAPIDEFKSANDLYSSPSFDAYRNIVRFACENQIDLYIVISPVHAYLTEATRFAGLWPVWEQWERGLVADAETEAKKYGCEPFPVWDFSGYNDITTETINASRKPKDTPRWYWDSAHYKTAAGNKVLERIFSDSDSDDTSFGVRLNSSNITWHLSDIEAQRARYAEDHTDEVAVVRETVRATLENGGQQ